MRRCWPLLAALAGILAGGDARAADPLALAAILTTHPRLEILRACYQGEKDALLADRRTVAEKLAGIEAYRRSLTDETRQVAARDRTDRAVEQVREAVAALDRRLVLADRKTQLTLRVLRTLDPSGSAAKPMPPDDRRRALNWLASAAHESRGIDRDLAIDRGFENDPVPVERLAGLVDGLQVVSARPDAPFEVKILTKGIGLGVVATATTIYFDKAYLDRKPSEAELQFVAGRELAHVQLGHFSEALLGMARDRREAGGESGRAGTVSPDGSKKAWAMIRERRWTQRQEEAADLLGALLALEAGASPKGAREAIMRGDADETPSAGFRAERLDRLKSLEAVLGDKFWERTDLTFGNCPR